MGDRPVGGRQRSRLRSTRWGYSPQLFLNFVFNVFAVCAFRQSKRCGKYDVEQEISRRLIRCVLQCAATYLTRRVLCSVSSHVAHGDGLDEARLSNEALWQLTMQQRESTSRMEVFLGVDWCLLSRIFNNRASPFQWVEFNPLAYKVHRPLRRALSIRR